MPVHSRPDTLIPNGADASIYAGASPDTSQQPQPAAGAMTDAETSSLLEGTDAERIDALDCAQQSVRRSPRRTSRFRLHVTAHHAAASPSPWPPPHTRGAHGGGVPCIASRRPQGERQGRPEGSRVAARWLGKYSTGTTVLDPPVQ